MFCLLVVLIPASDLLERLVSDCYVLIGTYSLTHSTAVATGGLVANEARAYDDEESVASS